MNKAGGACKGAAGKVLTAGSRVGGWKKRLGLCLGAGVWLSRTRPQRGQHLSVGLTLPGAMGKA